MNILFVIDGLNIGGAQTFLLRLTRALARQHKITIYVLLPSARNAKLEESFLSGVDVRIVPARRITPKENWLIGKIGNLLSRLGIKDVRAKISQWILSRHFHQYLENHNIDVINSHLFASDWHVIQSIGKKDIPWIVSMHGCYETFLHGGYYEKFNPNLIDSSFIERAKKVFEKANGFILASDKNKEINEYLPGNLINSIKQDKIYYGFEPNSYSTKIRVDYALSENKIIFGMLARSIEEKGWKFLIESFIELMKEGFDAQLVLVSDKSDHYEELVRKYNHENIFFAGPSYNPIEWISMFDVAILPTYFSGESLPNSVIEYLYASKPVIATDIGDIKQMITHEGETAGFLIPLKENRPDRDALKNALRTYLLNPELIATHGAIAKKAFSKFTMESCVESYLNFFNKV